jgi:hypothetical protein
MIKRARRIIEMRDSGDVGMQQADGLFFVDSRAPFTIADIAAVTLSTTDLPVAPIANLPVLGSNYFGWAGKAVRIRMLGRITTGVTPGNGTWDIYWGNGGAAAGTIIASSAAFALTASQTNLTWELDLYVRCRSLGAAGSLICFGMFNANVGVVASTLQPVMIPASAPAAVTVDLTQANVISPQFKRSGSTVETLQVHEVMFEAMN